MSEPSNELADTLSWLLSEADARDYSDRVGLDDRYIEFRGHRANIWASVLREARNQPDKVQAIVDLASKRYPQHAVTIAAAAEAYLAVRATAKRDIRPTHSQKRRSLTVSLFLALVLLLFIMSVILLFNSSFATRYKNQNSTAESGGLPPSGNTELIAHGELKLTAVSVQTGSKTSIAASPDATVKWLAKLTQDRMQLKTGLDTGGTFAFPIKWVIVDSESREVFEGLKRSDQAQLAAIVRDKLTHIRTRDPNTSLSRAGVHDGMIFHMYPVEDEREPIIPTNPIMPPKPDIDGDKVPSPALPDDNPPGPLVPAESENAVVTLVWSNEPRDLDLHLLVKSNAEKAHFWYGRLGQLKVFPWVCLDRDITTGRGPETVSIGKLTTANYLVAVHNYSHETESVVSKSRVGVVTRHNRVEFKCPENGVGVWWIVCEINGRTGQVSKINKLTTSLEEYE
jgi:hypothetical protein